MASKKKNGKDGSGSGVKSVSSQGGVSSSMDFLKWIVVFVLIAGGVFANSYYASTAWALRAACGVLILCAAFGVALLTSPGQRAWAFAQSARIELRKVVWPTRQEVQQSTLMVVVVVVITALVLWGLDTVFLKGIGWLVGQRG